MHVARVFETWLGRNCMFMHLARQAALVKLVDGLMLGAKATLSELGRGLRNEVFGEAQHQVRGSADR